MRARRNSTCPGCKGRISKGDEITRNGRGQWVCADCANGSAPEAKPARDWSGFVPSKYQDAVRALVETVKAHLVIGAVAGSGKSTLLEWLFAVVRQAVLGRVLFCAFNKRIAAELADRLPSWAVCSTVHSMGFRACGRAFKGGRVNLRARKAGDLYGERWPFLVKQGGTARERENNLAIWRVVSPLFDLARSTLRTERGDFGWLIDRYSIEVNGGIEQLDTVFDRVEYLLGATVERFESTGEVDFTDMIFLPVRLRLPVQTFDTVFVDETQDLNRCQVELVLRFAGRGGRVVAVGDHRQSIYGFAGADTDAVPDLISRLRSTSRGCQVAPLSVCYRCPTSHLELAREIVPEIEAAPGAPAGEVRDLRDVDALVAEYVERKAELPEAQPLVLCRTNAPLVGPVYKLLRAGVPARIEGRDVGRNLVALIEKVNPDGNQDLPQFLAALAHYEEAEAAKLAAAGREAPLQALRDKVECVVALSAGQEGVGGLKAAIEQLFSDAEDAERKGWRGVTFSTVHKAKGAQAAEVAIIEPRLLPGPWARQAWEEEQEANLLYVALTRSKRRLTFVGGRPDIGACAAPVDTSFDFGANVEDEDDPQDPEPTPTPPAPEPEDEGDPEPPAAPVRAADLPTWEAKGNGEYVGCSLEDWQEVLAAYQAAGVSGALTTPKGWKQWALVLGTNSRPDRVVRVSTTVDVRTSGKAARAKGANAIDIVLVKDENGRPLAGRKKVLRRDGWRGRVAARVNELLRKERFVV